MRNDLQQLLILVDEVGIEAALRTINIEDVDDPTIKIILRTIDNSIETLRNKLHTS